MTDGPRLLVRLGSMGDVVLATAAASAWAARAGGPVDVLVKEEWASVWNGHPAVGTVHVLDRAGRGRRGLGPLARRLRARRYREAVDLQGSPRTRWLLVSAGVGAVRRPRGTALRRRLLVRMKRFGPAGDASTLRRYLDAVHPGAEALPELHPDAAAVARARELVPEGTLGLVVGAAHATKRWPLERYVAVGRRWRAERGGGAAVFLGPDEEEIAGELARLGAEPEIFAVVREPLPVAAAALARCATVITGDTGLMHVAAAMGTPVAALFGPTVRAFGFAPAGEGHRVLEVPLACRPCSVHGTSTCPRSHFRCMLDLDADHVHDAAAALADARPGPVPRRTAT